MVQEAERALETFTVGARVDLYAWTRRLAMRIAMRALFGLDPDEELGAGDRRGGPVPSALSFLRDQIRPRLHDYADPVGCA